MSNRSGLTLSDGIPLCIGSVMGAGILVLPSLTYQESGAETAVAWGLAIAACLPLILVFTEMAKAEPNGDVIEDYVRTAFAP